MSSCEISLYVDADSVPVSIRAVIIRAAVRLDIPTLFVADRKLKDVLVASEEQTAMKRKEARDGGMTDKNAIRAVKGNITQVVVESHEGSADDYLVLHLAIPALAITHDIPLAARLIEKGAVVLDDRGNVYTSGNIAPRLSERDVNTRLREWGVQPERTKRMDAAQLKAFSDAFDSALTKMMRGGF